MSRNNYPAAIVLTVTVTTAVALLARWGSQKTYGTAAFFQPGDVKSIAQQLPHGSEDEFILAAWNYVANTIPYEHLASDMSFRNGEVMCADCYFPTEIIARDKGNCIAKSSLMASILANRIPMDRIQIIVGEYLGSSTGGHAWIELWRQGDWDLIETTAPPGNQPWQVATTLYGRKYMPSVVLENNSLKYASKDEVARMIGCACDIDKK